jgi:hypothetical protein
MKLKRSIIQSIIRNGMDVDGMTVIMLSPDYCGSESKTPHIFFIPRSVLEDAKGGGHVYLSRNELEELSRGRVADTLRNKAVRLVCTPRRGWVD